MEGRKKKRKCDGKRIDGSAGPRIRGGEQGTRGGGGK
jgi:hypothetical protein